MSTGIEVQTAGKGKATEAATQQSAGPAGTTPNASGKAGCERAPQQPPGKVITSWIRSAVNENEFGTPNEVGVLLAAIGTKASIAFSGDLGEDDEDDLVMSTWEEMDATKHCTAAGRALWDKLQPWESYPDGKTPAGCSECGQATNRVHREQRRMWHVYVWLGKAMVVANVLEGPGSMREAELIATAFAKRGDAGTLILPAGVEPPRWLKRRVEKTRSSQSTNSQALRFDLGFVRDQCMGQLVTLWIREAVAGREFATANEVGVLVEAIRVEATKRFARTKRFTRPNQAVLETVRELDAMHRCTPEGKAMWRKLGMTGIYPDGTPPTSDGKVVDGVTNE